MSIETQSETEKAEFLEALDKVEKMILAEKARLEEEIHTITDVSEGTGKGAKARITHWYRVNAFAKYAAPISLALLLVAAPVITLGGSGRADATVSDPMGPGEEFPGYNKDVEGWAKEYGWGSMSDMSIKWECDDRGRVATMLKSDKDCEKEAKEKRDNP